MNQIAQARFISNDRNDIPLVIRTTMGAGDGSGPMHSQSLHGLLAGVPGLVVVCPSTPADAAGLLKAAADHPDPVIMLEHKGLYGYSEACDPALPVVPIGEGRLVREGSEVTIVSIGNMLHQAVEAAEALSGRGIEVEIIDPRTIVPLDLNILINSVQKTRRLLVVDEGPRVGGFADIVISSLMSEAFSAFRAAPQKLTPPQTPVPYGAALEAAWLPDASAIVTKVDEMLYDE
jgi:pyruvate dehydrogenase E1 component beta subunit